MIATCISGFVYAEWNDTIVIRNEMKFGRWNDPPNMGFVEPLTWSDNEVTKDVGECICSYTDYKIDPVTGLDGYNTTSITINNGYPGYEVHCNFTVKNIGMLALHINETVISDPTSALTWSASLNALVDTDGKPVLNISVVPDLVCTDLLSEEIMEAEMSVYLTQNAKQAYTYYFQVRIIYEEA